MKGPLPDYVLIPPCLFRVELKADLVSEDGTQLDGWCRFSTQEIQIREELPETMRWVTLLHEIVHALLVQAGQRDHAEDEGLVDAVAYGLMNTRMGTRPLILPLDRDDDG